MYYYYKSCFHITLLSIFCAKTPVPANCEIYLFARNQSDSYKEYFCTRAFTNNFTHPMSITAFYIRFLTQRSTRASQRGWVSKPTKHPVEFELDTTKITATAEEKLKIDDILLPLEYQHIEPSLYPS